jgi:hypothetical protein
LKSRVAHLTSELYKANQTIDFLSKLTGQNPDLIKRNLGNVSEPPFLPQSVERGEPKKLQRQDSAVTTKQGQLEDPSRPNTQNMVQLSMRQTFLRQNNASNAANESKDAITGRII